MLKNHRRTDRVPLRCSNYAKGATVPAGFRNDTDGVRRVDPLFWSQREAVEPRLSSNPVEFDGIRSRVTGTPDLRSRPGKSIIH